MMTSSIAASPSSGVSTRAGNPGQRAAIAVDLVAKSPPDGYNILIGTDAVASNPYVYSQNFDPVRDLERRRQECRALGLTQRQHALTVALPRYARKVAGVLAQKPLW